MKQDEMEWKNSWRKVAEAQENRLMVEISRKGRVV